MIAEAGETNAVVVTPAGERAFKLPFVEAYNLDNALAAIAAGVALGLPLDGMAERAPGIVFSRLRGEIVELPGDAILINDSYNANPISMRAALDHLASLPAGGRRVAVLGEMRELGPEAAAYHREIGEHARRRGVELLIGVGELGQEYDPDAAGARRGGGGGGARRAPPAGRRDPGQGLARGRPRAGRREAGEVMLGEILIAGMAAMLICIFLGPRFIEYLRVKEFGQQIREEGPEEHHEKAGTPTMGGLIIFTAIAIPYLVLSDRDVASLAVFGVAIGCAAIGFADDFLKLVKRRSLGLSARWKLASSSCSRSASTTSPRTRSGWSR